MGLKDAHNIAGKVYKRGPTDFVRRNQIGGEIKHSTASHSYFITPHSERMSNNNNCFVCGKKGHIGHQFTQAHWL